MENTEAVKTIIDSQVVITGTIKSAGSIQIDGKLEGDLQCEADAVIGKDANIKGNMTVNSVSILGTINGNVTAKDRIEMKSSARIMGDIKSKRLTVEDGVTFIGRSEVNPSGTPVSQSPAPEKAAPTEPEEAPEKNDSGKGGPSFGRK